MTAEAPKRPRGRPLTPLVGDPFAAPPFVEERRKRWADLVTALAEVQLRRLVNGRHLLGEALAERMFPTDEWPRYTVPHDPPGKGAVIRNADGRGREAVDRWLRSRTGPEPIEARIPEHKMEKPWPLPKLDLPWLQATAAAQHEGTVRQWGERHLVLADRLEAFAAAPHDPATARAAAEALDKLTPEPLPGARAPLATPRGAAMLAADCRRVAADVGEWLEKNNTRHGRRAFAHAVADVVADLFDAAGAGDAVVCKRQSAVAAGAGPRGPVGPYCVAVEAALKALDPHLSTSWRSAAEAVCERRKATATGGA